jgi:nucleotide-binding universal stress UspA family protein
VLWAAAEAAARGRPLTVVHGVGAERQGYWTPDEAEVIITEGGRLLDHVQSAVAKEYPDLAVATTLSRSEPAGALLEAAGAGDTLVVGSRGRGGFASLLLGSVSLRVAARSSGPVVVVRTVPETATGTVVAAVLVVGHRQRGDAVVHEELGDLREGGARPGPYRASPFCWFRAAAVRADEVPPGPEGGDARGRARRS